jgi:hypothetical protein
MTHRHEEISQAYQRTFAWIFEGALKEGTRKADSTSDVRL